MRVRQGDLVQIISGKDRGKQGRVIESRPKEQRVFVENLNIVKKHQRPRPVRGTGRMGAPQILPGGVIEMPAPVPISNVMLVCPTCNRPTRVGVVHKHVKDKEVPVRVCRRADCRAEID
jgi:large subunit ribosomal protein L24